MWKFFFGFSTLPWPKPENAPKTVQKTVKKLVENGKKTFLDRKGNSIENSKTLKKRSENGKKTVPENAEKTSPENVKNTLRKKTRKKPPQIFSIYVYIYI